jgi:hypothetical protein
VGYTTNENYPLDSTKPYRWQMGDRPMLVRWAGNQPSDVDVLMFILRRQPGAFGEVGALAGGGKTHGISLFDRALSDDEAAELSSLSEVSSAFEKIRRKMFRYASSPYDILD